MVQIRDLETAKRHHHIQHALPVNSTSYDIIGTFFPTIGPGCRKKPKDFCVSTIYTFREWFLRCFHSTCLQHIPEGYSDIPSGNIAMESMNIHMFIRKYIFVAGPCSIAILGSHAGGYMKPSRMCPCWTPFGWISHPLQNFTAMVVELQGC